MLPAIANSFLYPSSLPHAFKVTITPDSGSWKYHRQGGRVWDRYNNLTSVATVGTLATPSTWTTLNVSDHTICLIFPLSSPGSHSWTNVLGSVDTWSYSAPNETFTIPIAKVTWASGVPTVEQLQFGDIDLLGAQKIDSTSQYAVNSIGASYITKQLSYNFTSLYLGYTADGKIKLFNVGSTNAAFLEFDATQLDNSKDFQVSGGYLQMRTKKMYIDVILSSPMKAKLVEGDWGAWVNVIQVGPLTCP